MAKVVYGLIKSFPSDRGVQFDFHEIEKNKVDSDEEHIWNLQSLPFLIWTKFKSNKVKITIEKA